MHACSPSHRLKTSCHSRLRRVNVSDKNTPSVHHPRRWNVTTSMVGCKKCYIHTNLSNNGEWDLAGNTGEEELCSCGDIKHYNHIVIIYQVHIYHKSSVSSSYLSILWTIGSPHDVTTNLRHSSLFSLLFSRCRSVPSLSTHRCYLPIVFSVFPS